MGQIHRLERSPRANPSARRFIGRERELMRLDAALDAARAGRGTAILVTGDPGIGKTRTVEELEERALAQGFRTYWGRCHADGGAPAFWPWLQVLRAHTERSEPVGLARELGDHAAVLAQLVPALRARLPGVPVPPALGVEEGRFRLLESLAGFMRKASASAPWLVLLDDLQWADLPTLQLLRFAARELIDAPVVFLGTVRDAELDGGSPATRHLREASLERIDLVGFSEAETSRFLSGLLGRPASPELSRSVCESTGGNPFFVDRIAATLGAASDDAGDLTRMPSEIRDVLLGQLARLDDADARTLRAAAVIGRDFNVGLLARASKDEPATALARLDAALHARLIQTADGEGRFRFVHALIHEVVYGSLSSAARAELHQRVGEALERNAGTDDPHTLSALAHHFMRAAPLGDRARAGHYAERAAALAAEVHAYTEAARLLESALELLAPSPADDARRAELGIRLGDSRRGMGDIGPARDAFRAAAAAARRTNEAELLARAALGYAGFWASIGGVDFETVSLLEEAGSALGSRQPALRARLLARGALEHALGGAADHPERAPRCRAAVALARESGDPSAIAHALYAEQMLNPEGLTDPARARVWEEAIRLAEQSEEYELALVSLGWQASDRLREGDLPGFDAAVSAHRALAARIGHQTAEMNHVAWHGLEAAREGRFADAEISIMEVPRRFALPQAPLYTVPPLVALRWLQGRLVEVMPFIRGMADAMTEARGLHAWLAGMHAELGEHDAATARFALVSANDFELLRRDPFWLLSATFAAQACALVGSAEEAAWLAERLRPHASRRAMHANGIADFGPVARTLGVLAASVGEFDRAVDDLETSAGLDARIGAPAQLALDRGALADVLLERGGAGDRARAAELASQARDVATKLGMAALLRRLDTLHPGTAAVDATRDGAIEARLSREPDGWTLACAGQRHALENLIGFAYLHTLLQKPGEALHASALVGAEPATLEELRALRDALDDAEALGNVERAEALRDALETRAGQLASRDLGGERARVNATRALRLAARRIAELHPRLGRDLESNLRTGTFCSYTPDPHHPVRWTV